MINRTEYIDDYGLQLDPLFDMFDELQAQLVLANKESSANVENALNHYSRAKQAEAKLDEVSILADEILVESVNSVCEFPMKVIAAKLQAILEKDNEQI